MTLRLPALTLLLGSLVSAGAAGGSTPRERTFELVYTATVKEVPTGARALDLWLPYPQSDAHQTVHSVRVEAPGPVTIGREARFGNQAVYFRQENPRRPVTLTLRVTATRRENRGTVEDLDSREAEQYLASEPLVPTGGPVRALALEAVRGKKTDAEKARAIYEHVTALMKYDKSGTGWGRGDAIWACDAKRGNCTDFHALIIGAARSQGIPARFAIGLSLPEQRGAGEVPGYHCWAELYVRGRGWVPVDSSEGAKALARGDRAKKDYYYGHHDPDRLELSRGRHLTLSPAQKSGPLNFFVYPLAEVDGENHQAVERTVRYADCG